MPTEFPLPVSLPSSYHTIPDLAHCICLAFRIEHARMHAKHRGHEAMHAEMVLILIATLVVAQLLLVQWKQRHPRSYNVSHFAHFFACQSSRDSS